ncbi:hypothetical protein C0993_001242 [Termitomyces sp. T159_Od127]|nr:hypothetical protein C0993_001242 [Termitomyces sp. T159_Od127]
MAVFLAIGLESTLRAESASVEFSLLTSGLRIAVLFTVVAATTGGVAFVVAILARVARVAVVVVVVVFGAGFVRVEALVEGTLEAIAVRDNHQRPRPDSRPAFQVPIQW